MDLFKKVGFWMLVGPFECMVFLFLAAQWEYAQWAAPLFIFFVLIPQAMLQEKFVGKRLAEITMFAMIGYLVLSLPPMALLGIEEVYFQYSMIALGAGIVLYTAVWAIRSGLHRRLWTQLKSADWHEASIAYHLARCEGWKIIIGMEGMFILMGLITLSGFLPINVWIFAFTTLVAGVFFFLNWWSEGGMFVPNTTTGATLGVCVLTILSWLGIQLDGWMILGGAVVLVLLFVMTYISYVEMEPDKRDYFWDR